MRAIVDYGKFNTNVDSAIIPIDDERRVIIKADVLVEEIVNEIEDGEEVIETVETIETKVLKVIFEDDSLSNRIELTLDEKEFYSFIKLLQVMARAHLKVSV